MSDSINASLVQSSASIVVKTAPDGGFQPTQTGVTLRNSIAQQGQQRIDTLTDVVPGYIAGSTLVYDPVTDKYIVKLMDIDGGNF